MSDAITVTAIGVVSTIGSIWILRGVTDDEIIAFSCDARMGRDIAESMLVDDAPVCRVESWQIIDREPRFTPDHDHPTLTP